MRNPQLHRLTPGALLLGALVLGLSLRAHHPALAAPATPSPGSMQTMPATPPPPGATINPNQQEIQRLQTQIQSMRAELHQQLDPLQTQIKTLHDKYDSQISSLEDQRKTLIESGKPAAIQDLDKQEESELAALSERETSDIEKVKSQYADQRKEIQENYRVKRGETKTAKN